MLLLKLRDQAKTASAAASQVVKAERAKQAALRAELAEAHEYTALVIEQRDEHCRIMAQVVDKMNAQLIEREPASNAQIAALHAAEAALDLQHAALQEQCSEMKQQVAHICADLTRVEKAMSRQVGRYGDQTNRKRQVEDNHRNYRDVRTQLQYEVATQHAGFTVELTQHDQQITQLRATLQMLGAQADRSSNASNPNMLNNLAAGQALMNSEHARLHSERLELIRQIEEQRRFRWEMEMAVRQTLKDQQLEEDRQVGNITELSELHEDQVELRRQAADWREQQRLKEEQNNLEMELLLHSMES